MYKIGVKFHFDSAHYLRNYEGKCSKLHGHRWEVEVVLAGEKLDSKGMLVDFTHVKTLLGEITQKFDHANLTEIPPFDAINPTAENIARVIYEIFTKKIPGEITVRKVRVWETPECWAEYGA